MTIELNVTAPGGASFFNQDYMATLVEELHKGTPDLLSTEELLIIERTPQLTGSLALDTTGQAYPDATSDTLVELYPADENQLDEYNRIYAQYVEGGPLGQSSDKISSPSEMYFRVTTDDIPNVEEWGYTQLQRGLDRLGAGKGIVP